MNYLIDTCVISEYLKKVPCQRVINWLDEQDEQKLYLSCLTIAELKKGCFKLAVKNTANSKTRAQKIDNWIQRLETRFEGRIVGIETTALAKWAQLCGQSEAIGNKLPVIDSLITATAQVHRMIVVTRNVEDFERCYETLETFNPYEKTHPRLKIGAN